MFHARNLFALETAEVSVELTRIVRETRRDGTAPEVRLLFKGAGHQVVALLSPKSKNEMVAVLPLGSSYVTTRDRSLCPLVEQFENGRKLMLQGRTGFENPVSNLCEVWGVPDLEAFNQFFLCVRHLLVHVLQDVNDLKDLYEDTRYKLNYLRSVGVKIEPLNDPANKYEPSPDLFDNSGAVGWPVIRALQIEAVEEPLLALLRMTLNNPKLTLQWRTMEGEWGTEFEDAVVDWEIHYGAMWGPFQ